MFEEENHNGFWHDPMENGVRAETNETIGIINGTSFKVIREDLSALAPDQINKISVRPSRTAEALKRRLEL
jgi:hypothetical protein